MGFGELILILAVALVVFGPRKLPELGRSMGKAIREFKQATRDLTQEVTRAVTVEEERPRPAPARAAAARPAAPAPPANPPAAATPPTDGTVSPPATAGAGSPGGEGESKADT